VFTSLPPLTLYVHLPWCERKCPYCDFNSHEIAAPVPHEAYVDALIADLEQDLPTVWGRTCHAVFIGGGTPSLFPPGAIERLLSMVRARLPLAPDAEITMEANPGSSEAGRFAGFREAGVNRLSIGVQSFSTPLLESIGRVHDAEQAAAAVEYARAAGFENVNLDLMYALPGQTVEQCLEDVRTALALAPAHLSHYQLTLEPNTRFHRHPPALPDEETSWTMQQEAGALSAARGYQRYEISAWARPGMRCRHNLNYWQFGDYLGVGAGAHGKITTPERIRRVGKVPGPKQYLRRAGGTERIARSRTLDAREAAFEFMLNALRLAEPVPVAIFQERTGTTLATIRGVVDQACAEGLMRMERGRLGATEKGSRYLNELLERFLPPD